MDEDGRRIRGTKISARTESKLPSASQKSRSDNKGKLKSDSSTNQETASDPQATPAFLYEYDGNRWPDSVTKWSVNGDQDTGNPILFRDSKKSTSTLSTATLKSAESTISTLSLGDLKGVLPIVMTTPSTRASLPRPQYFTAKPIPVKPQAAIANSYPARPIGQNVAFIITT